MPIKRDKISVGGREIPLEDIEKYLKPEQISRLIELKKIPKLKKTNKDGERNGSSKEVLSE